MKTTEQILNPTIKLSPCMVLEMMLNATRYCIGRHTYVSSTADTFASIIRRNREKFNQDRLQFFARDIRSYISDSVSWKKNVHVENDSNDRIRTDAYTLIANWLEQNPGCRFCDYDFEVDCLRNEVQADRLSEPLMKFQDVPEELYDSDLVYWIRLANFIDQSTHFKVTTKFEGQTAEHICISFPEADQIYDEEKHRCEGYTYRTAYKDIENIGNALYLASEYITNVELIEQ